MTRSQEISKRLLDLKKELGKTELIAVTKYSAIEDLIISYNEKQFDFGESKVNALKEKALHFEKENLNLVRWHFIGHLQTNKVKELLKIPNLHTIHSVDSIRLLQELIKNQSFFTGTKLNIFLQVNTSHEDEKSGFESMIELEEAINLLLSNNSIFKFKGLMTMGALRTDDFNQAAKKCFSELNKVKKTIQDKYSLTDLKLSMGMSQDYKIAIEEGSDFVRIGSAIYK
jgi:pyridoxal phosphate enzyme (YggS family)